MATTGEQKNAQQPVILKEGDTLCALDNQLQKLPLQGDHYYLSGSTEGMLKAFEKSLRELIPEEVRNTRYPVPGTYKNILVEEMIPLIVELASKLLPAASDVKVGEAMTHAQAGVFHVLHRLVHVLRGSGDAQAVVRLLASLVRDEEIDEKGSKVLKISELPWDDVNGTVGAGGKTLASYFDDKPTIAEQKTRLVVLRKRMNSVEAVAYEADNRMMAQNVREKVTDENQFLFDAFLKTISEQPFLRSLTSPLVRNRAIYAILNRIHRGVDEKEEKYTVLQNATLQDLGRMIGKLKTEQEFNDWYQSFVK